MDNIEATKMFHEFLGITASIETCTAGTKSEEINSRELMSHFFEASEGNFVCHETTAKTKGSANCLGLFIALFQSPMRVRSWAQLDLLIRCHLHPSQIQRGTIRMQNANLPILHTDEVLCVPIEGRSLRCNEHAIRSDSNHKRRTVTCHNELIGCIRAHDTQPPRPIASCHGLFGGLFQRSPILIVNLSNEFGYNFGIRLTREHVSPRLKLATEFVGIVERAIVDECNFARTVEVRVSIFVRFSSVSGPTGVCDADMVTFGCNRAFSDKFETIRIFSNGSILCYSKSIRGITNSCNASTVVPTILQNG
mmetsp:Transcript_40571/g.85152  ORF Transcript_40571/g.85152 Transcript_40571/m.85152 type:complete len:308 (-) Transcript_40571:655-1578(-)